MSDPIPLQTPGGFAPAFALGMDDGTGNLSLVSEARPLPVMAFGPAGAGAGTAAGVIPVPSPIEGEAEGVMRAGPFVPAAGRTIMLTLAGDWDGTAALLRSVDDGDTVHPLTLAGAPWARFTGNACEPVWVEHEEGASLWLDCALTRGTLTYRVAQ